MSQSNPLLEPLGAHRVLPDWPALLEKDPLVDLPKNPSAEDRETYVYKIKDRFAVTKASLNIAFDIQYMIRNGYQDRNPCDPENQRKAYAIAALEEKFTTRMPVFFPDSQCKIIMGITGMGKSKVLARILSTYPQVAIHGPNESAQWLKHTQLVHLTVKMPGDGSRSGLLYAILSAVDAALFTNYLDEYKGSQNTIEKLAVKCAQLLASLSLGVLAIEEMQPGNFMTSKYRKELQLFFLGLLSFGVPLIMVGNPLAFGDIDKYTQTQRRFLSREPEELWPYESPTDPDWINAIAPAIWNHQVTENADTFTSEIAEALWRCSGGIPAYAKRLVEEIQLSVLKRTAKKLSKSTLEQHYRDLISFHQFRNLIEGLINRDSELLVAHEDIPVDKFEQRWKASEKIDNSTKLSAENHSETELPTSQTEEPDKWDKFKKRTKRNKKTAATRKKNKKKRGKKTAESVGKDDLRHAGTAKEKLSIGLDALRDQIQGDENEK